MGSSEKPTYTITQLLFHLIQPLNFGLEAAWDNAVMVEW